MSKNGVSVRLHGVLTYKTTTADIDHLLELAKKHQTSVNFVYALESGGNETGCKDETGFPQYVRGLAGYLSEKKKQAPRSPPRKAPSAR